MIKEHLNYEENIIESFRLLSNPEHNLCYSHPLFLPDTDNCNQVFRSIQQDVLWAKWINSSGKNKPPPDYYNDEMKMMMDIMRVDDSAHRDELTGKLVNPIRARESELIRELKEKGIFDAFPEIKNVIVSAKTDLPPDEDHNYFYYRDNFIRIIGTHMDKIPLYIKNHPGFKITFFVFDESSTYIKLEDGQSKTALDGKGDIAQGRLHIWWFDEVFLNTFIGSEIDFLIWVTPYKQAKIEGGTEIKPSCVCVFDVKNMNLKTIFYTARRMVST